MGYDVFPKMAHNPKCGAEILKRRRDELCAVLQTELLWAVATIKTSTRLSYKGFELSDLEIHINVGLGT